VHCIEHLLLLSDGVLELLLRLWEWQRRRCIVGGRVVVLGLGGDFDTTTATTATTGGGGTLFNRRSTQGFANATELLVVRRNLGFEVG